MIEYKSSAPSSVRDPVDTSKHMGKYIHTPTSGKYVKKGTIYKKIKIKSEKIGSSVYMAIIYLLYIYKPLSFAMKIYSH